MLKANRLMSLWKATASTEQMMVIYEMWIVWYISLILNFRTQNFFDNIFQCYYTNHFIEWIALNYSNDETINKAGKCLILFVNLPHIHFLHLERLPCEHAHCETLTAFLQVFDHAIQPLVYDQRDLQSCELAFHPMSER